MRNEGRLKYAVWRCVGLFVCVAPAVCATLSYFPLWSSRGADTALSGLTLLILLLSALPLARAIKERLRSISAWVVWLMLFTVFFCLSRIADEMTVISFIGLISNVIGALILRYAERYSKENGNEG